MKKTISMYSLHTPLNPAWRLIIRIRLTIYFLYRSSHQSCSIKKVFFETAQNSQENTWARVSFLTPFLQIPSGRLLLPLLDNNFPQSCNYLSRNESEFVCCTTIPWRVRFMLLIAIVAEFSLSYLTPSNKDFIIHEKRWVFTLHPWYRFLYLFVIVLIRKDQKINCQTLGMYGEFGFSLGNSRNIKNKN